MQKASKTEARIHEKSMKNMMRLRTGPRDAPIGPEWAEPPPEGDPGEAGPGHRGDHGLRPATLALDPCSRLYIY